VEFDRGQDTVCTEAGTTITVRFVDMEWPHFVQYGGDLPPITFDMRNAPVDEQTLRTWGSGSRLCFGVGCGSLDPDQASVNSTSGTYTAVASVAVGDEHASGVVLSGTATEVSCSQLKQRSGAHDNAPQPASLARARGHE
jgi:hypothetical protein